MAETASRISVMLSNCQCLHGKKQWPAELHQAVYWHRCGLIAYLTVFTSRPRGWLVLRLLCHFRVCISVYLCVRTYHERDNYVTYIVAMQPYFSRPQQLRRLLCVAAMSSLPQLRHRDGYWEAEAT